MTFVEWLEKTKQFTSRSARDVQSRLKRVIDLLGSDELSEQSIQAIEEVEGFNEMSVFIKAQLRRSIRLYLEYQEANT